MNIKAKILSLIKENNQSEGHFLSTSDLANKLNVKRNTVSHYLNQLVKENQIIKINTRPVIFVDRSSVGQDSDQPLKQEYASIAELKQSLSGSDTFKSVIGHDQSLYSQIRKLKAAASYPGRLPILINGQTGTGKSYIARKFFDYCVEKGYIAAQGKFVSFNCAEYADNPELLTSTLFGYAKGAFTGADEAHKGLFDEADNGMLFLDEVHRLDPKGQEKLFSYLDTGTVSSLGEAAEKRQVNVRLICATTEDIQSSFLSTFIRRIPVQITMPPLKERTSNEIRSLIIYFYIQHAKKIGRSLQINNQVFATLMNMDFKSNIGQLKNAVLLSVASALGEADSAGTVQVKLGDLPQDILLSEVNLDKQGMSQSQSDIVINSESKLTDFINNRQSINYIKQTFENIFSMYEQEDFSSFQIKAFSKVNALCDYLVFKKDILDIGELPLDFIKKSLNSEIGYLQDDLRNDFNGNLIVAISYYFYFRQENCWSVSPHEGQLATEIITKMNESNYTAQVVQTVINVVSKMLNLHTDEIDNLFLTIYLSGVQRKKNSGLIHCILLAHGYSTASSIADTVNKIAGEPLLDAFDMPIDIQTEDIAQKVSNYIHVRHVTNGLILMADMGSLEKIPELLKKDLNFPVVIFNNVSTQLALFVASYVKERRPIDTIVQKMDKVIHNDYRIVYPKMVKQNVIIVCCSTGVGTANKIKEMIQESLPKDVDIKIMACSYEWLKIEDQESAIKRKYNVLVVIGTIDPKYSSVPFISLDQLVNGSKISLLQGTLKDSLSVDDLYRFNDLILKNFSIERVINSLTILDTKEVIKNIDLCIKKIDEYLDTRLPNQTIMALYVHISCMIERIIRNQVLEIEPIDFKIDKNSQDNFNYIKKALHLLEQVYNIKIPLVEVEYIYELIFKTKNNQLDYTKDDDF
ncbi:sigma 54-interacting transcriptional regulator [Lactobacillus sp. ESL0731]|uniref:sigma 54-interacting transcriptional regulator n=1 Tax=unclassified Lactobacillus TaxID=2620435 RepID=UPI0023F7E5E1|nr:MULTISPECIES: sigma 54-interacting transcriptional regulator [unclassified Lactobacillus]WEV51536.1 sigma 54-interacting transcriptional regulator [Lactobacillus sp. ESL0700]WEV62664.1 sigma 54-interacting transcriptional regulator [Lactobacillus sp. ESL0731]